jgi:hypothetical protein
MKEQVQETGVRKWFGDDFIDLQTEMNEGAKSPYTDFGSCVISGAAVTNNGNGTYTIADGIAYLVNNLGNERKALPHLRPDFSRLPAFLFTWCKLPGIKHRYQLTEGFTRMAITRMS